MRRCELRLARDVVQSDRFGTCARVNPSELTTREGGVDPGGKRGALEDEKRGALEGGRRMGGNREGDVQGGGVEDVSNVVLEEWMGNCAPSEP